MGEIAEETKNVVTFYKIDKFNFDADQANDLSIREIMGDSIEYKSETKIKRRDRNGYGVILYYLHKEIQYNKWDKFFSDVLDSPNDTFYGGARITPFKGRYLSFVCFFEKGKEIYAICVGKAHLAIERFIEHDFGFNLLTRLIKPESNLLKQLSANHLAGSTFEDISSFRSSESFTSQDDFGKIFKHAISELDLKALAALGIDTKEIQKANCIAKSSFKLKSGITLNWIVDKILPCLSNLLRDENRPNFLINRVKAINKSHLIFSDLELALSEKIRLEFASFDFFSPEETLKFLSADKYEVVRYASGYVFSKGEDDLSNAENLLRTIKANNLLDFKDPKKFKIELEHTKINAFDENDFQVLQQKFSLIRGLHGELTFKQHKYFWLNGKFWQIDKQFLEDFNNTIFANISEASYRRLDHDIKFEFYDLSNNEREDEYNGRQGKKNRFINLDKKTAKGVEMCDLLYESQDTLYLIHVKKGFDRNVRDLTSQISTAARFLYDDRGIDLYKAEIYSNKKGDKMPITKAKFIKMFNKNIVFVFAFVFSKNIFDKVQFEKLNSNIAKLELFELLKQFKKYNPPFALKIIQLPSK